MSRTIVVTGAGGQVGLDLVDYLTGRTPPGGDPAFQPDGRPVREGEFRVEGRTRAQLDITDRAEVRAVISSIRPDVVVNLAAYTKVDRAETDVERCASVNHAGVRNLVELCSDFDARLVTVSTDYVFDGTKGAAYGEDDAPRPLNVYGATKLDGELACRAQDLVVRTSWVVGVRGTSVAHVIVERARRGEPMAFVDDQRGTPTFASDLARALVTGIREDLVGTWHVAGTGDVTWFEFARALADAAADRADLVRPVTTAELDPPPVARRPARSDLSTDRWRGAGFGALPTWGEGLGRFLAAR